MAASHGQPATPSMPPSRLPLTLIVATAENLGIGNNSQLPWRLKSELQYFSRVTTRLPALSPASAPDPHQNALIMGRKTWESIPAARRPLKGRVNVVLSSRAGKLEGWEEPTGTNGAIWVRNFDEALKTLAELGGPRVARAFVTGGRAIYEEALRRPETKRVLLTRVGGQWECDTFFPIDLESEDARGKGWTRSSPERWREWTGEEGKEESGMEGDVAFEYRMYERHGPPEE